MPRTPKIYSRNVNIKISPGQYTEWKSFASKKGIEHMATFIRWGINAIVNGELVEIKKSKMTSPMEERMNKIEKNEKQMEILNNEIRDLIRVLAKQTPPPAEPKLREYQKSLVFNLIKEKPRNEKEIKTILPEMTDQELLTIINDFLEMGLMDMNRDGTYKVI